MCRLLVVMFGELFARPACTVVGKLCRRIRHAILVVLDLAAVKRHGVAVVGVGVCLRGLCARSRSGFLHRERAGMESIERGVFC